MFFYNEYRGRLEFARLALSAIETKSLEGSIIQLGCWAGKQSCILAKCMYPEILICCDEWQGLKRESIATGKTHPTEITAKETNIFDHFVHNMNSYTHLNYTVVKKDCVDFIKEYNGKIKFLFINDSNDYGTVHEIISSALPKMVEGGCICGENFIHAHKDRKDLQGGVERAVRELLPSFDHKNNLWYCKIEASSK